MKIAVYTISLNEDKHIKRWAESAKDADYRVLVDTGSTDNTVKIAKDAGCIVHHISVKPWRFDVARNEALALVPEDVDICVSLDADEVLMPGWRQHLESLPPSVTRPRYKYVWSWNPDGSEGLTFLRDHIHKRHGYYWKHPVHEVLMPKGEEVQAPCGLVVHHHPDPSKSRSQYLPLLELAVQEDPDDDRNRFYLGRELVFNNRGTEAAPHFLRHLELSKWDAERSSSMRYLANITGNKEHWLLRACAETPHRREPWVDLAMHYYDKHQWSLCLGASERALSIEQKPLEYLCEPEAWGERAHDLASIAAWNLDMKDAAMIHAKRAFRIAPHDNRIRGNLAMMLRASNKVKTKVDIIITTKSYTEGLSRIFSCVEKDPIVDNVYIVCDGSDSFNKVSELGLSSDNVTIDISQVPLGSGIQKMWNCGLARVKWFNHAMFLNDDVVLGDLCVSTLAATLDNDETIGLVSPNYDNRLIGDISTPVFGACGTLGKEGIAGASMMLHKKLVPEWSFDENMKWYFGDDDIAWWVSETKKMKTVISGLSTVSENCSWTIQNDPPADFEEAIKKDKDIFYTKWNIV